jgi:hypothetical protein
MPTALVVQVAGVAPSNAAVVAPVGQSFTVTPSDLQFILTQIKIAERHTATLSPLEPCSTLVGTAPFQIADALVSKGLRTVDGSCNNLIPGQETFGAADEVFPRIASKSFRDAAAWSPRTAGTRRSSAGTWSSTPSRAWSAT